VPSESKEIPDRPVHHQEQLRLRPRLEATHLSFALARRLMREFCSIVRIPRRVVDDRRRHDPMRHAVAAQLVGDQSTGLGPLPFQQLAKEALRRYPMTGRAAAVRMPTAS